MKKILKTHLFFSFFYLSSLFAAPYGLVEHNITQYYTQELVAQISLYSQKKPNKQGYLSVSDVHKLYYAEYGNPQGQPVIYLHGGPGGGADESITQLFDPEFYRIILYDQRGAGKSIPHASMEDNHTNALIEDLEKLRQHLHVDQWLISGGSWGSALALAYTQTYPNHVQGLILRGVFDGTREQYLHLLYGMKKTYPEAWSDFINFLPEHERGNLIRAYYQRVMDPNPHTHMPAARAFVKYDLICGMFEPDQAKIEEILKDDKFVLGVSRGFMYYAFNDFFMKKFQIRNQMHLIQDKPIVIIQGRYDIITPPSNAHKIYRKSKNTTMMIVQDAGHFDSEPGISLGLVAASEYFKQYLNKNS